FTVPVSGAGQESSILKHKEPAYVSDTSPDGRLLVYDQAASAGYDVWLLPMEGGRKAAPFLATPFNERASQVSPDGKGMAYVSDESGARELYVRSFPESGAKWPVSSGGAAYPRWRRDGKEIFYVGPDGALMAVSVRRAAAGLGFGTPVTIPVFVQALAGGYSYPYDVTPDGQRILAIAPVAGGRVVEPLTLFINWEAALKKWNRSPSLTTASPPSSAGADGRSVTRP